MVVSPMMNMPLYVVYDTNFHENWDRKYHPRVIYFRYDGKGRYYRCKWYILDENRINRSYEDTINEMGNGRWDLKQLCNTDKSIDGWMFFYSEEEFLKNYSWLLFL